jgi:hypothetical protein
VAGRPAPVEVGAQREVDLRRDLRHRLAGRTAGRGDQERDAAARGTTRPRDRSSRGRSKRNRPQRALECVRSWFDEIHESRRTRIRRVYAPAFSSRNRARVLGSARDSAFASR